jgi:hypothetical protein
MFELGLSMRVWRVVDAAILMCGVGRFMAASKVLGEETVSGSGAGQGSKEGGS